MDDELLQIANAIGTLSRKQSPWINLAEEYPLPGNRDGHIKIWRTDAPEYMNYERDCPQYVVICAGKLGAKTFYRSELVGSAAAATLLSAQWVQEWQDQESKDRAAEWLKDCPA